MAARRLRSFVSRLMLVAGLAAMLAVGAFAVGGPSTASAKPVDCGTAMNIAWGYLALANTMNDLGYTNLYNIYYAKYEALADMFYPC
jgi:hypothetical protein